MIQELRCKHWLERAIATQLPLEVVHMVWSEVVS